jgi:hypothetical protein
MYYDFAFSVLLRHTLPHAVNHALHPPEFGRFARERAGPHIVAVAIMDQMGFLLGQETQYA